MSPYLMCPKSCDGCPFVRDCYEKTFFDFGENVISADPVLEDLFFHSEKED